jgi:hypothetical protein
VLVSVGGQVIVGFGIAVLLNRVIPFKGLITTLLLLPMMMSAAVVGLFWQLLYSPSWGPINYIFGLGDFPWLTACFAQQNGLTLRVCASDGAIKWKQENPNYLDLYKYGEPRQTLTPGQGYLSEAAKNATRIPTGHPEGYLEAFGTIYIGIVRAIRAHIDGKPLKTAEYDFPTVYDGLRGVQFITTRSNRAMPARVG